MYALFVGVRYKTSLISLIPPLVEGHVAPKTSPPMWSTPSHLSTRLSMKDFDEPCSVKMTSFASRMRLMGESGTAYQLIVFCPMKLLTEDSMYVPHSSKFSAIYTARTVTTGKYLCLCLVSYSTYFCILRQFILVLINFL